MDGSVASFLGSLGNSTSLFEAAQTNHESIYDHFFTNFGWIDYRVVVGTGVLTPGSIAIEGKLGGESTVHLGIVNGDETVPAKSATTGQVGSQPANLGVHVQDIGHITHMKEAESNRSSRTTWNTSTSAARPERPKDLPRPAAH